MTRQLGHSETVRYYMNLEETINKKKFFSRLIPSKN